MNEDSTQPKTSATTLSTLFNITLFIFFANWFAMFAVAVYLHGDALGTVPSRHGYFVTSHGARSEVSESEWLFSLAHTSTTLCAFPFFLLLIGVKSLSEMTTFQRILLLVFIAIFLPLFWANIATKGLRSWSAYRALKSQQITPVERN